MYNNTDVLQFGSADTKLKQLYMRVAEMEQANQELTK
jgi:hypothetical protein